MSMPSPFELGRAIGGNVAGGVKQGAEMSAMDKILKAADESGDPEVVRNIMGQMIQRVAPERREMAAQIFKNKYEQIKGRSDLQKQAQAYSEQGLNPNLPEALNVQLLKQKANEDLWGTAIAERNAKLGISAAPSGQQQQQQQQPQQANITPDQVQNQQNQQQINESPATSKQQELPRIKPVYASTNVDPRFFRNDIAKFEKARLAEAEKGYKRNESFLKTAQEQSSTQPFIQDSIRQALVDVDSGNVSGALATIRNRLGKTWPSVLSAQEKNFSNAMKNIALEQFASTPGFRSQGEFFILQQVLPGLGDKKKSQEMNLKAILDASLMKSKEEEIIMDVIQESSDGEVPLNLQDIVKDRMDHEWKKLYARRYAEDPEIWDKYISHNPSDPLFKDIKNVPVPSSSINWKEYVPMLNKEGKKVAVHKDIVEDKIKNKYTKVAK